MTNLHHYDDYSKMQTENTSVSFNILDKNPFHQEAKHMCDEKRIQSVDMGRIRLQDHTRFEEFPTPGYLMMDAVPR